MLLRIGIVVCLLCGLGPIALRAESAAPATVISVAGGSMAEKLAAREVRRYVYLRTGKLLPLATPVVEGPLANPVAGALIVVGCKDRPEITALPVDAAYIAALRPQEYLLKTIRQADRPVLLVVGGDPTGTLYGAYALAEKLGVRFYLHGDVIPDQQIAFELPHLDEAGKPLFALRGIQPFHDFPEGPDWWSTDDYRAYVAQLAKLRMNFIGMHNYNGELLLWHGVAEDVNPDGTVKTTYPSKWFSNVNGGYNWGYAATKTSDFTGGAAELFAQDAVFSEVVGKDDRHFDRVGKLLGTVVADAHARGVKVCVGSESPVWMPGRAAQRLKQLGRSDGPREIYKGIFQWLMKNAPVDYYWLWTPEGWIWSGNSVAAYKAVENDLKAAQAALRDVGNPFPVGTCGWVLGPQQDRAAWDQLLPKDSPMANINPLVSHAPIDPSFSSIHNRPKWAIPWFENDPDLLAYQPWVKRTRYDAVDALRRGCTGLMGIHWRTKILAPNIAAMAQAGWDQSWAKPELLMKADVKKSGTAAVFTAPVAGTAQESVYQSLRYGLDAYPVEVPNGLYTVTLKFNEPHYGHAGARVFSVKVQGEMVAEHLDIFARVGKNRPLDITAPKVRVADGVVDIAFISETEFPSIAGIEIVGTATSGSMPTGADAASAQPAAKAFARRINVGGPAWNNFEADATKENADYESGLNRGMPADDFYRDFARAQFGESIAEAAGKILADADGFPAAFKPSTANGFLGTTCWPLRVVREPWEDYRAAHYAFVERFAILRPQVRGDGNLERFDYWMNTFRATELMAKLACQRGALDAAVERLNAEKHPATKKSLAEAALALRRQLVRGWEELIRLQIVLVSTPGELGTIANLEQRTRVKNNWLTVHDKALADALGVPLPSDCAPSKSYTGPGKLTVPTVRSSAAKGEVLVLKIIAMDNQPVKTVTVHVRPLGTGDWKTIPAAHLARAVYEAKLPATQEDFEYYVTAGENLIWPATAPKMNQTVIVTE